MKKFREYKLENVQILKVIRNWKVLEFKPYRLIVGINSKV